MIIHDCEQNTPEWHAARLGIPTGSCFKKILTTKGKLSAQADEYENRLVAEILTGESCEEFFGSKWTDRGHELEPKAVDAYEVLRDADTLKIGFVTDDARTFGCSPDRLIGEDGALELKCPSPAKHITYLLSGDIDEDHKPQVQGQLMVLGRKWIDVMSYHPTLPPSIIRVERDEAYIALLQAALAQVSLNVQAKLKKIKGE